jgi:predicted AAA+ superfamily ATPase
LIEDKGARFENMVALHLLKWVHFKVDTEGLDLELRYFRDIDGREVDFIVTEAGRPILAVECKWKTADIHPGLQYFKNKFSQCEAVQITMEPCEPYINKDGIRVWNALQFLGNLI